MRSIPESRVPVSARPEDVNDVAHGLECVKGNPHHEHHAERGGRQSASETRRNCAALWCKKLKYLKTARMMRFSVMSAVSSKLRVRAPRCEPAAGTCCNPKERSG